MSTVEEETLLIDFNNTAATYPKDKNIVALFEEQAERSPEAVAIVFKDEQLSYKELNARSNQLARYLQTQGVKAETLVPICIKRSPEMVIGILGILKAGGTYVPVDPEYPQDRISYMLEDTGAKIVLSSRAGREKLNRTKQAQVIELDGDWKQIEKEQGSNLKEAIGSDQLAYIIYTSGSTGRPKGVMIEHNSLVNYLLNSKARYINREKGGSGSFIHLSCTFDASLTAMFMPLLSGKSIVLSSMDSIEVFEDSNLMKYAPYDFIKITPAHLELIHSKLKYGNRKLLTKKLVIGGEALHAGHFSRLIEEGIDIEVINEYGPTEATVGCSTYSFYPVTDREKIKKAIPIGKPIDNTQIYILGEQSQLAPIGVTGEICIGGEGLARGYLNQPELTTGKFTSNPFSKEAGARVYKTGDLGRWLSDGNIEYLGRKDDQVKVRGYRIELGEIESILNESGLVQQAVVLAKADSSLVGYVVLQGSFDKQAVQNHLGTKLPDYMVPALWVELKSLPLTANGKVDRKALPDPELTDLATEYAAPRNETEAKLTEIWQKLLGVEHIGIYDNFFELGGHSLLAMRVASSIRLELGLELGIRELFVHPEIAGLTAYLETNNKKKLRSLIPIKASGNKPPLYIICGAGGTVFKFLEFAQLLDRDQPVYGLQQFTDNNDPEEFPDTIEGIAAQYIEDIVAENPEGPYALSGHCLGGIIAFEMASQLEAMGKKVLLLAMFDTNLRQEKEKIKSSLYSFNHIASIIKKGISIISVKIKFELFLLTKHPKQALLYKITKVSPWLGIYDAKPENIEQDVFDKLTLKLEKALNSYKVKYYDGGILLFSAMKNYFFVDVEKKIIYKEIPVNYKAKYAWKEYVKSFEVHEIEGEHSTIFNKENAQEFSRILQRHLDESVILDQETTGATN